MVEAHVNAVERLLEVSDQWGPSLERACEALRRLKTEQPYHRVFVAGNGGSAANASHCAAHLVDAGFDARCLTDNTPLFTARANDLSYDEALIGSMSGFLSAARLRMDAVILFSCSGTSDNIRQFERVFGEAGALVITFYGMSRKRTWEYALENYTAHYPIDLDSENYGAIEDAHSVMMHGMKAALR